MARFKSFSVVSRSPIKKVKKDQGKSPNQYQMSTIFLMFLAFQSRARDIHLDQKFYVLVRLFSLPCSFPVLMFGFNSGGISRSFLLLIRLDTLPALFSHSLSRRSIDISRPTSVRLVSALRLPKSNVLTINRLRIDSSK